MPNWIPCMREWIPWGTQEQQDMGNVMDVDDEGGKCATIPGAPGSEQGPIRQPVPRRTLAPYRRSYPLRMAPRRSIRNENSPLTMGAGRPRLHLRDGPKTMR